MEFKYDVRDLKFILKEWLPTGEVLACDRYKDNFSMDDIDMLLNEGCKVAGVVFNRAAESFSAPASARLAWPALPTARSPCKPWTRAINWPRPTRPPAASAVPPSVAPT